MHSTIDKFGEFSEVSTGFTKVEFVIVYWFFSVGVPVKLYFYELHWTMMTITMTVMVVVVVVMAVVVMMM